MENKNTIIKIKNYLLPKSGFVDIKEFFATNGYGLDKQEYYLKLLLENELISLNGIDNWSVKLTARGIVLKDEDLNDDGTFKKKKDWWSFWKIIIASSIGALVGLTPTLWQKDTVLNPIVIPKIQIAHDTVYKEKMVSPHKPN